MPTPLGGAAQGAGDGHGGAAPQAARPKCQASTGLGQIPKIQDRIGAEFLYVFKTGRRPVNPVRRPAALPFAPGGRRRTTTSRQLDGLERPYDTWAWGTCSNAGGTDATADSPAETSDSSATTTWTVETLTGGVDGRPAPSPSPPRTRPATSSATPWTPSKATGATSATPAGQQPPPGPPRGTNPASGGQDLRPWTRKASGGPRANSATVGTPTLRGALRERRLRPPRHAPKATRPPPPGPGRSSGGALHLDQGAAARSGGTCATGRPLTSGGGRTPDPSCRSSLPSSRVVLKTQGANRWTRSGTPSSPSRPPLPSSSAWQH